MTRIRLLTGSALALTLLGAVAGAAQAQSAPDFPLPYDARRGVFSFATGLERSLPAVVQVTTLGMSAGPTTGQTEPAPLSSGSGVIIDAANGETLAKVSMSTFCRGDGGFGGENKPGPTPAAIPEREPDHVCDLATLPRQALIYRLSGDYNPLHADPKVARAAGFERPILHGLATYGLAARAILKTLLDYNASRLTGLDVRFSAPVYPGETVRFDIWREGDGARFRASVAERQVVVLDNGTARFV